tara:strand:+ start:993 stop:1256 length:264 start_codon:yes stop_codon:yes gene_type:complete
MYHINHTNFQSNMIDQTLMPVNKRLMLYHINMIHHNKTALKRRVGGIYDPHQACLIILINSLKGDDVAGQYNQTNTYDSRRLQQLNN